MLLSMAPFWLGPPQICIRLKFPHRYLVLESLTGPKEFWYLNAFDSQAELDEVSREYEGNKQEFPQNLKGP